MRLLQRLGAKGVIIIDHVVGTSEKSSAPFGMSGDGNEGSVHIPAVFLFNVEGEELRNHMRKIQDERPGEKITVQLSSQPKGNYFEFRIKIGCSISRTDVLLVGKWKLYSQGFCFNFYTCHLSLHYFCSSQKYHHQPQLIRQVKTSHLRQKHQIL